MRSPEELDSVDWSDTTHAYGNADDVPLLIQALYSGDAEAADDAIWEFFGSIVHQGTVYPAAVEAVPFLTHAAVNVPSHRARILMLLVEIGGGAVTGSVMSEARAQVAAEAPHLWPFLDDADRAVRRAAVRLATITNAIIRHAALRHVLAIYEYDPVPEVRADALTALSIIDVDRAAAADREALALSSPMPPVRLAAALLTMERCGPPYSPELVEALAAGGTDPDPGEDDFPFPGLGTVEHRTGRIVKSDLECALFMARVWIDSGDRGSLGSHYADQIGGVWRDREHDVVLLLADALPHQRDPDLLAVRLEAMARWIAHDDAPAPALLGALLDYAASEHARTAAAAQLSLARIGDDRFLDITELPDSAAMIALAARTGLVEHRRRALAAPNPRFLGELLTTLAPTDTTFLPEFKNLLRTRCAPVIVARHVGGSGSTSGELLDLLKQAVDSSDDVLSTASAVALARLTGQIAPALSLLERRLAAGRQAHWWLDEAARLGPTGSDLTPQIEELCYSDHDWTRMAAAEAHWRITGDPLRAIPILAEIAGPSPVGLRALQALAAIGSAPEDLQPRLNNWARSPRRLVSTGWPPAVPHPDDEFRDACLQLLG